MELKEVIKKYHLKEVSDKELVQHFCTLANEDFKAYGTTFYDDLDEWCEDIDTALNNGYVTAKVDDNALYKCYIEVYNGKHTEAYQFYVLVKDNGEDTEERYFI